MLEIGLCTVMLATDADPAGLHCIPMLKEIGYDYAEIPAAQIMDLPDSAFHELCHMLKALDLPCGAVNNFVQKEIRLTGPEVHLDVVQEYLKRTVARVAELGAKRLVFGSAGARNVQDGFDRVRAWDQLKEFLYLASEEVKPYGIMIVIEPINHGESNIVNATGDGTRLMEEVHLPNVQMLVDYFHYTVEHDTKDEIQRLKGSLHHTHISQPKGRVFPTREQGDEYHGFFQALRDIGYNERISVEGYSAFAQRDAAEALATLRMLANF